MNRVVLLLAVLPGAPHHLAAQGLPFHTQSALTTAFEERGLRAFSMIQRRGDVTVAVSPLVVLPFAPHQRVTTLVSLPIVYKRMSGGAEAGSVSYSNAGFGDATFSVKWAFYGRDRFRGTTRLAVILSGGLPTGSTGATFDDGVLAPPPLQLGTGAVSGGITLVGTLVRDRWGSTRMSATLDTHVTMGSGSVPPPDTTFRLAFACRRTSRPSGPEPYRSTSSGMDQLPEETTKRVMRGQTPVATWRT